MILIDGIQVYFPYSSVYPEQIAYMQSLKKSFDSNGHCLIEMPTGTGKTVSLLAFYLSYRLANPNCGKLIYCTRTVQEMDKVVEELKNVYKYVCNQETNIAKQEHSNAQFLDNMFAICLSSRRNLCIHPQVSKYSDKESVDSMCRKMTAPQVREDKNGSTSSKAIDSLDLCEFYEGLINQTYTQSKKSNNEFKNDEDNKNTYLTKISGKYATKLRGGVYSINDVKEFGRENSICPYFLVRFIITHATIIIYNYQYILDRRISELVSEDLDKNSIVVFDEAHNIDNICMESLSVKLDRRTLIQALKNLKQLNLSINETETKTTNQLKLEYTKLVQNLKRSVDEGNNKADNDNNGSENKESSEESFPPTIPLNSFHINKNLLSYIESQISSSEFLFGMEKFIPGNIRKARHFVVFMRTIIEHIFSRLSHRSLFKLSTTQFLIGLKNETKMSSNQMLAMKFCMDRLRSLLNVLEIADLNEYSALQKVCDFTTLSAQYSKGFIVLLEPYDQSKVQLYDEANSYSSSGVTYHDPIIRLCCLDPSICMKNVLDRFRNIVITSGTLSPIQLYPKILCFKPKVCESYSMSMKRNCIQPLIVSRGNDQTILSSKFELRQDSVVLSNYGNLLYDLCCVVPDGIVCFFTSYAYMDTALSHQQNENLLDKIFDKKLIFIETQDVVETTLALENFKKACDCGRGAVFLSIARGKVAEGIDFNDHYGRCVLLCGVPFQFSKSHVLQARLEYFKQTHKIFENDYLAFDALRQAAQCVGRVIRSKSDYGLIIFADNRYSRSDKRQKLPKWILRCIDSSNTSLSSDHALELAKQFYRQIAQ